MGSRHYKCTPWGMPTYNIFGWQKPCYLLQDGYCDTFAELIETTEWERYGTESGNRKCANCMVHSGYEASRGGRHVRFRRRPFACRTSHTLRRSLCGQEAAWMLSSSRIRHRAGADRSVDDQAIATGNGNGMMSKAMSKPRMYIRGFEDPSRFDQPI